jgi:hypothetical protein
MVLTNTDDSTFKINELPKAKQARFFSCLVNINDKQVLFIGGTRRNGSALASVYEYIIAGDSKPKNYPELKVSRIHASGCYVDGKIFVISG